MKKFLLIIAFFAVHIAIAQDSNKVWDLLLKNNRQEARKLYNKEFAKKKDSSIDLLVLDAILDQEEGKLLYDKSFLEKFSKFK